MVLANKKREAWQPLSFLMVNDGFWGKVRGNFPMYKAKLTVFYQKTVKKLPYPQFTKDRLCR